MITDPLLAGGTAAVILKGLNLLEALINKRRNGTNGNGFTRDDHDTLTIAAARQVQFYDGMQRGLDRLHNDLDDVKEILLRDRA